MSKQGVVYVSKEDLNTQQLNERMTAVPPVTTTSAQTPNPNTEFQRLLKNDETKVSDQMLPPSGSHSSSDSPSPNQEKTDSQSLVTSAIKPDSKQQSGAKLANLENKADVVLFRIKAWLPDFLFPDELVIDASKVSVITNVFFSSARVRSVAFDDILNVTVGYVPWFATLEIADRYFTQEPIVISWLKKEDAVRARRIVQGLIIAKREGVDFQQIHPRELLEKVENLGSAT